MKWKPKKESRKNTEAIWATLFNTLKVFHMLCKLQHITCRGSSPNLWPPDNLLRQILWHMENDLSHGRYEFLNFTQHILENKTGYMVEQFLLQHACMNLDQPTLRDQKSFVSCLNPLKSQTNWTQKQLQSDNDKCCTTSWSPPHFFWTGHCEWTLEIDFLPHLSSKLGKIPSQQFEVSFLYSHQCQTCLLECSSSLLGCSYYPPVQRALHPHDHCHIHHLQPWPNIRVFSISMHITFLKLWSIYRKGKSMYLCPIQSKLLTLLYGNMYWYHDKNHISKEISQDHLFSPPKSAIPMKILTLNTYHYLVEVHCSQCQAETEGEPSPVRNSLASPLPSLFPSLSFYPKPAWRWQLKFTNCKQTTENLWQMLCPVHLN